MPDAQILRVLELADRAGTVVALVPRAVDRSPAEEWLSVWLDISGRPGRTVDCETRETLDEDLSEASMVLLPDLADPQIYARAIGQSDAAEYLLEALDDGALILAEGTAGEALGEAVEGAEDSTRAELTAGLGWLPASVLLTHYAQPRTANILRKRPQWVQIGLPEETAIVLGPSGERELWGDLAPILTFGSGWTHESKP
jgi:hypothetical protein